MSLLSPHIDCQQVREDLSEYLDGAISGRKMLEIERHLASCAACSEEFAQASCLQQSFATLGQVKPPAALNLQLRLAISHERDHSWRKAFERVSLSWQNAVGPLLLQASAGVVSAVLLLGTIVSLLGAVGAASPVMANDEPLGAMTAPHFLYTIDGDRPVLTDRDDSTVVVEALINARGEVYDYRFVAGSPDPAMRGQIMERLATSVFRPASVFGVPVRGHVVLTFSGVSVRA